MDKQEFIRTAAIEAAKGTPPVSVSIISQADRWTMANTVTVLTMVYLALQICWLIWQWRQARRKAKREEASQRQAACEVRNG